MNLMQEFAAYALVEYKPQGQKGEDAYAFDFSDPQLHTQAVFDGCGGAGAWRYPEFHYAKGAFVAAHAIASVFLGWSRGLKDQGVACPTEAAESFRRMAWDELTHLKESCAPMGIAGTMVKSFPCTAAVAIQQLTAPKRLTLTALNAGDSRVYYLTPEEGLVQVTKDESCYSPDPLESLRASPTLSNMLNADKPFTVTPCQVEISLPCAVICATDGMFSALRSPMDFEYLLLNRLAYAGSLHEFEAGFQRKLAEIANDDSTCVMSFYGWKDMGSIRTSLEKRTRDVADIINGLEEGQEQVLREYWQQYRKKTLWYERQR